MAIVQGNGPKTKVTTTTAANPILLQAHETQAGIVSVLVEGHLFSLSQAALTELLPYLTKFAASGSLT